MWLLQEWLHVRSRGGRVLVSLCVCVCITAVQQACTIALQGCTSWMVQGTANLMHLMHQSSLGCHTRSCLTPITPRPRKKGWKKEKNKRGRLALSVPLSTSAHLLADEWQATRGQDHLEALSSASGAGSSSGGGGGGGWASRGGGCRQSGSQHVLMMVRWIKLCSMAHVQCTEVMVVHVSLLKGVFWVEAVTQNPSHTAMHALGFSRL